MEDGLPHAPLSRLFQLAPAVGRGLGVDVNARQEKLGNVLIGSRQNVGEVAFDVDAVLNCDASDVDAENSTQFAKRRRELEEIPGGVVVKPAVPR